MVDTRHEYNHLFGIYVPIAIAVWVVITAVTLFALWRYRASRQQTPGGKTERNVAEILYVTVLAAITTFLVTVTFTTEDKVDAVPRKPGLLVNVAAGQWNWRFSYPAHPGIQILSGTDKPGTLVVPSGTQLVMRMTTSDVVHSFWVPETRIKRDVFPGKVAELALSFPRPGTFRGECAEYCGLHHADMLFSVRAVPPAQFAAWVRSQQTKTGGAS